MSEFDKCPECGAELVYEGGPTAYIYECESRDFRNEDNTPDFFAQSRVCLKRVVEQLREDNACLTGELDDARSKTKNDYLWCESCINGKEDNYHCVDCTAFDAPNNWEARDDSKT